MTMSNNFWVTCIHALYKGQAHMCMLKVDMGLC